MAKQIDTAKKMFPRMPWADGCSVVSTSDGRVHILVGRYTVTFSGETFEGRTERKTSGTSRKARGW